MRSSRVFSLLFLGLASHIPMVMAQSAGTFTTTGNMITPRVIHTATLLGDGRVLIAGGELLKGPALPKTLSSAELYDPRTGTFTATANMTTPRSSHSATLLPNGKVLVAGGGVTNAGGMGDAPTLASADLYDPGTGTFSTTGDMTTARFLHTATLLNNGKVLIAGGFQRNPGSLNGPGSLASAELYDPSTGTFTATGDMTSDSADTATLLANGKVLFTRGAEFGSDPLFFAELYDPDTGLFVGTGSTITNHTGPAATLLANGKVLVAGGDVIHYGNDGGSRDTEFTVSAKLYDQTQSAFAATGNMTMGREGQTATLLPDGTVLFAGGQSFPRYEVSAQLYDPIKGTFNTIGPMTVLAQHTATLLNNGQVLIAGVVLGDDSVELYTPAVVIPAPALLSLSGDGRGAGAILHADTHQVVSSSNPTTAGEALEIYGSRLIDGGVIPPQVAIGGRMAEVLYFGNAPGFAGLNQVNVRVPSGVAPGPAVPVRLTYIGRPSNEVTIGVR